jgi:hypothetical protein
VLNPNDHCPTSPVEALLKQLKIQKLVGCPSHNVITSDPSHRYATGSGVAGIDPRAAK